MTELGVTAQPPVTGTPVLEARGVTKHFPVHQSRRTGRGRLRQRGAGDRAASGRVSKKSIASGRLAKPMEAKVAVGLV